MEEEIKKLETQILALTDEIQEMKETQRKSQRDHTKKTIFTDRIVFRGEVFDKLGNKVIN
jgi:predicted  nucleic acid-binding Zn-ribbon protein